MKIEGILEILEQLQIEEWIDFGIECKEIRDINHVASLLEIEFNKKQSEIDELVAYIKNANIRFFTDESINEYNDLIQKHTKK